MGITTPLICKMKRLACRNRFLETRSTTSGHTTKTTSSHNPRALLVQAVEANINLTLSLEWPWPIINPCMMVKLKFVKHHPPLKTYSSRTKWTNDLAQASLSTPKIYRTNKISKWNKLRLGVLRSSSRWDTLMKILQINLLVSLPILAFKKLAEAKVIWTWAHKR